MRQAIFIIVIALSFSIKAQDLLAYNGGEEEHKVSVCAEPTSGLFTLKVESSKKIGTIRFQVRNAEGKVVYSESGKAKTNELVRYIDKSIFGKGDYTIEVVAKNFSITQVHSVR